jgi:uncharacterized repeat protein (TIGR03803 family)
MKRLSAYLWIGFAMCVAGAAHAGAQTASTFYGFSGVSAGDGNAPTVLIQAQDGNFYGVTSFGGGGGNNCLNNAGNADGCGTIFRLNSSGGEISPPLHSFTGGADGGIPSSIVQGPDGNIYVTTLIGGPDSTAVDTCTSTGDAAPCCVGANGPVTCGAIFEFNPSQTAPITLNPLYTFAGGTDGASPGTLILGSTASQPEIIFGTTLACTNCNLQVDDAGYSIYGTVFEFVPAGNTKVTPATIVAFPLSFTPNFSLAYPNSLIQSGEDTLYGTTQMGGAIATNTYCPANSDGMFGCGGVFEVSINEKTIAELCDFGDNSCFVAASVADGRLPASGESGEQVQPDIAVKQSGSRFPVGAEQWSFSTLPIALTIDSSGSIYGTTPPGCAEGSTYSPNPNCTGTNTNGDPAFEVSSVFKMVPPTSTNTTGTLDTLYSFTGNNDGSATETGLILAADGNFYGASGVGSSTSEVFDLKAGGISSYAALSSSDTPTWLIQGGDGNLYGTSSTGGSGFGAVFQVKPSTPFPPPVQLSFANASIDIGNTATLTWKVPNAYSITSQQCFPFVQPNQSGAGTWSSPGTATTADGVYSNSATITPTKTGTFNYSVTCGGVVSGYISLTVSPQRLSISPSSLAAITAETPYSETLTAGGGSGTGYKFSITTGAASLTALGLSLSSAGVISGTPTAGTAAFTVQLTDSLSDTYSQAYTLTVNKATPSVNWTTPAAITFGTALSATQLDAGAVFNENQVAGTFAYNPASGTMLTAGSQTLKVTFTPTDTTDYATATGQVTLTVNQATPTVSWTTPAAIAYGTALSATQLDASAVFNGSSVAGTFTYNPPAGTVLAVGSQTLKVTFTPTDTTDYTTATGQVMLTVNVAPGFTLSPSPVSVSVAQGGSGTSTITVTNVGGFSGSVTLAATGLPSGVTSSFAAGSAAGTQVLTLMASTSAQVTSTPVTVTVTGTSGTVSATTNISLTITPQPGFTGGGGGTTSMSISPGATTGNTGTVSIAGTNGFVGTVNLSCSVTTSMTNVSDMPSCSLNPPSVTISGATAQTSTLTVTTTPASSAENNTKRFVWPTGGTTLAAVVLLVIPRRRRSWLAMSGMILLCAVIGAVGCGGGSGGSGGGGGGGGGGNPGTTAGTYTITVTGTSGSVSATVGTVTLAIQ